MAAKVEQYIGKTCKMKHSFACTFRNCANRIFRSVSIIYCSFHSASHSCGSDEGSLQRSLWLPKFNSILQKLAKCSTALHGLLGVAPIEFFVEFLQYTSGKNRSLPNFVTVLGKLPNSRFSVIVLKIGILNFENYSHELNFNLWNFFGSPP